MELTFEKYLDASNQNYEASKEILSSEIEMFKKLDEELIAILNHLNARSDLMDDPLQRLSISLIAIIQRQFRSGFELFRRRLSFDGFAVVRVAIEAASHYFKISGDEKLIEKYLDLYDEDKDRKEFRKIFEHNLFPNNLPHGPRLKQLRDLINQMDAHPDFKYFIQTVELTEEENRKQLFVHYFDKDDNTYKLKMLQFFDCYWMCVDIVRRCLEAKDLLPIRMQGNRSTWQNITNRLSNYKESHREWVQQFIVG
jgi:hypothetical protein